MLANLKGPLISIVFGIGITIWSFFDRTAFLPGQGGRQRHEWIKEIFFSIFGEYSGLAFGVLFTLGGIGFLVKNIIRNR